MFARPSTGPEQFGVTAAASRPSSSRDSRASRRRRHCLAPAVRSATASP